MTTELTIKVLYLNGEATTFKNDSAFHFEILNNGTLFVEGKMQSDIEEMGRIKKRVKYSNYRTWIPLINVKSVEVQTRKEINDPEEIRKWEKFKSHGFDLMITPVSYTAPKTEEEVIKEIQKEEKKKARKAN